MSEVRDLIESYYNDVYIEEEQLDEIAISGTRSSVPGAKTKSQLMGSAKSTPSFQQSGGYGRYSPGARQVPSASRLPSPAQADAMDRSSGKPSRFTSPVGNLPAGRPNLNLKVSSAPKPKASTPVKSAAAPQMKPVGTSMDQWAAANPKLAAASSERARTRGTSATTNPLMKDMKSSLPAPTSTSPTTAKTGFDLAKKGIDLSKK